MAALIAKAEGVAVSGIERIDECLRENLPMLFYGKDLDLRPYFEEARSLCHATVKEMQSRVGRAEDIRSIVLTGGGAAIYAPFIRTAFPRTTVHMMESPCYANVRGFYLIGSAHHARGGKR
jgi:plasmid segregation protein ParM